MTIQLEAVSGLIELKDEYTGTIGLAEAALQQFSKHNQESLKAVAEAAGLVTASIGAVVGAVIALGNRGSDINDLTGTIEHFAGGAREADEAMEALRRGTLNTVSNFDLAKDAAHILSANVKLTAEDFKTLGDAAFVMQNRGLGGTKEQLDLVSEALVTGRTRALATKLGVVDLGDAEARYAESLGVTADQLSDTGKAEAHRIEVMDILRRAVKDAGAQERDFGEQLEAAQVFISNYIDELGSSVAQSPVFAAAMKSIGDAVSAAFSGDKEESIKSITHAIEEAATVSVNLGLAAVEGARVVHTAWSAIKTVVLGVETTLSGAAVLVLETISQVSKAAETLHIVPKGTTAELRDVQDQVKAMTASFAEQTAEAAKGVVGHSEFDATLDHLGGTLFQIKDSMEAASKATKDNADTTDIAANNARKLAETEAQIGKSMIDRAKIEADIWKVTEKSLEEEARLREDLAVLQASHSMDASEAQRRAIEAWFNDEVAKLKASDENWKNHYDALRAVADERLQDIDVDWDLLQSKSIDALEHQAEVARNTYNEMVANASHFTREALEEQRQKVEETRDAVRGMGDEFESAEDRATKGAKATAEALKEQAEAAKQAAAEKNRSMGGSFQITKGNLKENLNTWGIPWDFADAMAKKGASFQEILAAWMGHIDVKDWVPSGPRIPGYAQGGTTGEGWSMVGERGPELVRLPFGTQVFPTGTVPGISNQNIVNNWFVNGTAEEAARKIQRIIMKQMKSRIQFGSA